MMRLFAFLVLFAWQSLLMVGCSDPKCPRAYIQHGMRCARCPEGSTKRGNACFAADGGEVEPEDDSDAAIGGDESDAEAPDEGESAIDASLDGSGTSSSEVASEAGMSSTDCDANSCGTACESGSHICAGTCVSDTATASCGSRCAPCPTPPTNASATCLEGACGFACEADFVANAGACLRKNIYVSVTGSDSNDGTEAKPFRSFARATDGALSGQVINFAPGNYAETFERAVPKGVTVQRAPGSTMQVRFIGTGTQELLFAGDGSLRDVMIDGFGTPISSNSGSLAIEGVVVTSPYGPVRFAGSSVANMRDVALSGAPAMGPDARASLVKLSGSARLTVRGNSRFTGSFRCDYPNDPPSSAALYATGASQIDLQGTQISGAIWTAALFLEGTSTAHLAEVTAVVDSSCYGAAVDVRDSASVFVEGGTYAYAFSVGVRENTGRPTVELSGGSFKTLSWSWRGNLKVRNANFTGHIGLMAPSDGVNFDLGTPDSPGGNTFQDGTGAGEYFSALNQSATGTLYVNVSGNRWIPNEQGANASGRYEVGTTSANYPTQGRNFQVDLQSALRF